MDISLDAIRLDGGTQPRTQTNLFTVGEYAESMRAGAKFPDVVLFFDGADYWLADGFHRVRAATQAGLKEINADVKEGTRRDAVLFSVGANAGHGMRRTNEDKRKAVRTLLEDEEWSQWSDNKIAETCGVSNRFVGNVRDEWLSLNGSKMEPRRIVERNGTVYTQNTVNIGKSYDIRTVIRPELPYNTWQESEARSEAEILQVAKDIRMMRAEENQRRLEEIKAQPVIVPEGKFQCVVADPPWPMNRIHRDLYPDKVGMDYPTMTEDELMACPYVPDKAADNCHLYLWTTHRFLPMALRLVEHWGFRYQCLMTWVKNEGMVPYSWMYSTEHVLFCRKGNLQLERLGMRLHFSAKERQQSRKPDEFYDLVRQASPGPRIDIFSREQREGFEQFGFVEEVNKFAGGEDVGRIFDSQT